MEVPGQDDRLSPRGFVAPGFEPVRDAFQSLYDLGWDHGSSFSVYLNGRPVIQLTGGAVSPESIQMVASATKVVEAACIGLLVDRGLLRWDDLLALHWPELGIDQGDEKARISLRQLMMHRAGLPAFDRKLRNTEIFDLDARAAFLSGQVQEPGLFRAEEDWRTDAAPQAYHAVSRGLYSGELLRRVDPQRRSLGTFFRDEIGAPLGLDFWIGLPESEEPRVVPTRMDAAAFTFALSGEESADPRLAFQPNEREFLRRLFTEPGSLQQRALNCMLLEGVPPAELGNHRLTRAGELPSSNGVGNAEALARLMALLASGGELDGVRIFRDPGTLRSALLCAERYETDAVMLEPVEWTQGGFGRFAAEAGPVPFTFGWGGAGGQMARLVPELGLGCGYVTDTLGARFAAHDPRGRLLLAATLRCLERT